jgi:hypothetical protein
VRLEPAQDRADVVGLELSHELVTVLARKRSAMARRFPRVVAERFVNAVDW